MGFILKVSTFLLPVAFFLSCRDGVEGVNIASRYFLTIDVSNDGKRTDFTVSLRNIKSTLCNPKKKTVKCFLNFKVVGEPTVIIVMNVENSIELERRLTVLSRKNSFKYEAEPMIDYDVFAQNVLGIRNETADLKGNTLKQTPEVIWCEFNVNFGDKNATELLEIWKREAEAVYSYRKSGNALEIFKTLGERTVHLLTENTANVFDQILFQVPFGQEIPNTLRTTCKVAVKF